MGRAFIFSLFFHGAVLALLLLGGFFDPHEPLEIAFDEVEVITAEDFDALVSQSQAGQAGESDNAPQTQIETETPEAEAEVEPTPAPDQTQAETAVAEDAEISPNAEAQPLPIAEEADVSGLATADSEGQEQALETTSIFAPIPRDAAEIRAIAEQSEERAPEAQEVAAVESEQAVEEVEETPPDPPREENETNAVSEIRPEAQPDAPISAAPSVAVVPLARPEQLDRPEAEPSETAESTATASTEATEQPSTNTDAPASEATIDDLLAQVVGDGDAPAQGRGLSRIEQGSIIQKINNNWNKTTIIDKDDYTRLVSIVRFQTDQSGNLVGGIELLEPARPDNDGLIAFESARRAIIDSLPLEMPADIDPAGVVWRLKFDPADGVGLN